MTSPSVFHLSLVVDDLPSCKSFPQAVLNCSIGRENKQWLDINFFGHQLTIHQSDFDKKAHALDHFGIVLTKAD